MSPRKLELKGGKSLRPPYPIRGKYNFSDITIYSMDVGKSPTESPDFTIPSTTANIFAVDRDLHVQWIIDAVQSSGTGDSLYHHKVYDLKDRLVTKSNRGAFFQVDRGSGHIEDNWGSTECKINNQTIEFDEPVEDIAWHDGITILRTGTRLHGFDGAEKLWEREDDYEWLLSTEDGDFHIRTHISSERSWMEFQIDAVTGDIVDTVYEVYEKTDEVLEQERERR